MSPTLDAGNDDFKIDPAAPPGWVFSPGDSIIGSLVRKTPIVTPNAVITLSLTGRIKTRVAKNHNWWLFGPKNEVIIFRGPLCLAGDSGETLSWPFSVTIPEEPAKSCRIGHIQKASFLPLDRDHPGHHVLPGTFQSSHQLGFSEAFVEYFIKAQMMFIVGGYHKTLEAIWPITLRQPVEENSPRGGLQAFKGAGMMRSLRLLPGMEKTELSLKQRMQKRFNSSKGPEFHYKIHLTAPTTIQLDDPDPIPVQLKIIPLPDKTSVSLKDVPLKIQIDEMQLFLHSHTRALAPSQNLDDGREKMYTESTNLYLQQAFWELKSPLVISTDECNEPINIGNMLQLVLHPNGLTSGTRTLFPSAYIYPDFTTYSIKHTHSQEWKIWLTVAGETYKPEVSGPLKIIAAPLLAP